MGKGSTKVGETALANVAATPLAVSDYGDFAGAGFDNQTSEDVSIPFLGVIQGLSPELKGATKVQGAQIGMLINTVTKELFDGATGIYFQPVDTKHVFVEWKPRDAGGGFVAVHEIDSPIVAKCKETQEFGKFKTDTGNDLIETYYITGLQHRTLDLGEQSVAQPEPMIIAFTSTKIKSYKQVMTRLRTVKGRPPLFAHRLKVTTFDDKNNKGDFSNIRLEPAVENDVVKSLIPAKLGDSLHPLLAQGSELLNANRGGKLKVDHNKQGGGADEVAGEKPPF